LTDLTLKRAVRGDELAFEELVTPWLKGLYNFILYHVQNGGEDVYQETVMEIWKRLGSFDERSSLKTWMYGIARHKCADHYRREYRNADRTAAPEEILADEGFEERLAGRVDAQSLLQSMDSGDRSLLYLVYAQGFTCMEAARILDIPEGTVKSRLHYMKQALREQMGGECG
jgi:RNA polymerase sigma-70 factor, ECF subfamily